MFRGRCPGLVGVSWNWKASCPWARAITRPGRTTRIRTYRQDWARLKKGAFSRARERTSWPQFILPTPPRRQHPRNFVGCERVTNIGRHLQEKLWWDHAISFRHQPSLSEAARDELEWFCLSRRSKSELHRTGLVNTCAHRWSGGENIFQGRLTPWNYAAHDWRQRSGRHFCQLWNVSGVCTPNVWWASLLKCEERRDRRVSGLNFASSDHDDVFAFGRDIILMILKPYLCARIPEMLSAQKKLWRWYSRRVSTVSGGALRVQRKIWAAADFQSFLTRPNTRMHRPRKKGG